MDIREAFDKLTGYTDNVIIGKIRGTTKSEVRELCGVDWNEKAWNRMANFANRYKESVGGSTPFYDKKLKLWFWY